MVVKGGVSFADIRRTCRIQWVELAAMPKPVDDEAFGKGCGKQVAKMDKLKVIISNKQKEHKIPTGTRLLIRRCCHAVLELEAFEGSAEISVSFVDNEQIQEMNREYRQKDSPTDVLSFPMGEHGEYDINQATGAKILGDVVLSIPKVMEQAELYGHGFNREIAYLTAHSVLHLLGYDHEQGGLDRVRMREKEEIVMKELGLPASSSYAYEDET